MTEGVTGIGGVFVRSEHPQKLAAWYDYFGPSGQGQMLNFRVRDLDAMLAQLRAAGVRVDSNVHESEHGRFGWADDPDGNRFELWQPPPGRYPDG